MLGTLKKLVSVGTILRGYRCGCASVTQSTLYWVGESLQALVSKISTPHIQSLVEMGRLWRFHPAAVWPIKVAGQMQNEQNLLFCVFQILKLVFTCDFKPFKEFILVKNYTFHKLLIIFPENEEQKWSLEGYVNRNSKTSVPKT